MRPFCRSNQSQGADHQKHPKGDREQRRGDGIASPQQTTPPVDRPRRHATAKPQGSQSRRNPVGGVEANVRSDNHRSRNQNRRKPPRPLASDGFSISEARRTVSRRIRIGHLHPRLSFPFQRVPNSACSRTEPPSRHKACQRP